MFLLIELIMYAGNVSKTMMLPSAFLQHVRASMRKYALSKFGTTRPYYHERIIIFETLPIIVPYVSLLRRVLIEKMGFGKQAQILSLHTLPFPIFIKHYNLLNFTIYFENLVKLQWTEYPSNASSAPLTSFLTPQNWTG